MPKSARTNILSKAFEGSGGSLIAGAIAKLIESGGDESVLRPLLVPIAVALGCTVPVAGQAVLGIAFVVGAAKLAKRVAGDPEAEATTDQLRRFEDRQIELIELVKSFEQDGEVSARLSKFEQDEIAELTAAKVAAHIGAVVFQPNGPFADELSELLVYAKDTNTRIREIDPRLSELERLIRSIAAERTTTDGAPTTNLYAFAHGGRTRHDRFFGREDELRQLHETLIEGGGSANLTQTSLSGGGGFGKTALAYEFAQRALMRFDGRWWFDASTSERERGLKLLASDLLNRDIPDDADPDQVRNAISHRLGQGRHLVVLDNIDDAETWIDLHGVFQNAAILVTSRRRDLDGLESITVEKLEPDAARLLLLDASGDRFTGDEHTEAIDEILGFLGYHALSLRYAAAALRKATMTPARLFERLEKTKFDDPSHPLLRARTTKLSDYAKEVAASLTLLVDELDETERSDAYDVLRTLSFLAPDDIPLGFVVAGSPLDEARTEDMLDTLCDLSVIDRAGEGDTLRFSIHRLTGMLGRESTDQAARQELLGKLSGALQSELSGVEDLIPKAKHAAAEPHALAVSRACIKETNAALRVAGADLLGRVAMVMQSRVEYTDAGPLYEQASRVLEDTGADDPVHAVILNNWGMLRKTVGDLDGALEKYTEAERIDRAAFGDQHPNVAIRVNNIGSVLEAKGDLDGALEKYTEAERIDRAAFGDKHPEVAVDVNNIGSVLEDKGDLDGALEKYTEAERIDRVAFGDQHPKVAIRVNNIGSVLETKGDLDGALEKYTEAERIDRAAFGNQHPEVAVDVNNIGSVLKAKGDLEGAVARYTEAFRIVIRAFGPVGENVIPVGGNVLSLRTDPRPIALAEVGSEAAAVFEAALKAKYGEDVFDRFLK
ncbi:MAG: tetratricopeptide repeat protein [Planctomycetota bacterium]